LRVAHVNNPKKRWRHYFTFARAVAQVTLWGEGVALFAIKKIAACAYFTWASSLFDAET
jgi:hypothetical protein